MEVEVSLYRTVKNLLLWQRLYGGKYHGGKYHDSKYHDGERSSRNNDSKYDLEFIHQPGVLIYRESVASKHHHLRSNWGGTVIPSSSRQYCNEGFKAPNRAPKCDNLSEAPGGKSPSLMLCGSTPKNLLLDLFVPGQMNGYTIFRLFWNEAECIFIHTFF